LISFPAGTEMVQFPALAFTPQGSDDPALPGPGFPIRKSPRQRSLASSTGLIAGSCVLHRLLMPRHPPCALNNLTQFRNLSTSPPLPTPRGPPRRLSPTTIPIRRCQRTSRTLGPRGLSKIGSRLRIHRSVVTFRDRASCEDGFGSRDSWHRTRRHCAGSPERR
jgi:hypothetical protein